MHVLGRASPLTVRQRLLTHSSRYGKDYYPQNRTVGIEPGLLWTSEHMGVEVEDGSVMSADR